MLDEHGLTPKQRTFADGYIESGVGVQAALAAYDTDYDVARSIASENLTKPNIIRYIKDKCAKANLTVDKVLGRVVEALDAERVLISPTGANLGSVADHGIRLKAVELSMKVIPEFAVLRNGGGDSASSQHLHLHGVNADVLKKLAKKAT